MARCSACNQELEPGSTYCHICGTPVGAEGDGGSEAPKQDLVQLVEGVEKLRNRVQEVTSTPLRNLNESLGSPVSIQRQILYAVGSGFVVTGLFLGQVGWVSWLNLWLSSSFLLFWPIRYWATGILPLSGILTKVVGGELSLRRRILLALALTTFMAVLPGLFAMFLADTVSRSLESELERSLWSPRTGCLFLFTTIAAFFQFFYLMGFVATWRLITFSGFSITLRQMASQVKSVTDSLLTAMQTQDIPGLQVTRVELAKLEGSTWIPPGTLGEQLSLTHGKARVVIFVQRFGEGLFVRSVSFYDASGRRLWLLLGYFVAFLNRLGQRWFGSSLLAMAGQVAEVLSPANKQQLLLQEASGGPIARALRLVEGISEYSWNEILSLEGAVEEATIRVLQVAAGNQEEAERIRSHIESQLSRERQFASGSGTGGNGR